MYDSMFGAGSGSSAFATDMLILDDIEKENKKAKKEKSERSLAQALLCPTLVAASVGPKAYGMEGYCDVRR